MDNQNRIIKAPDKIYLHPVKAEELMIGDWVNYRPGWINEETGKPEYECGDVFPVKITCIYDGLAQYDDLLPDGTINTIEVADYELSGIPLTTEILEKNGFERDFEDGSLIWVDEQDVTEIVWGGTILTIHGENGHLELDTCMYVHELQHALRLCGIKKEIEI